MKRLLDRLPSKYVDYISKSGMVSDSAKSIYAIFSSNLLSMVVSAIAGLYIARLAGVERMGMLATAALIIPYSTFLNLSLPNGLSRQLPLHIGRGNRERAQSLANTAWYWGNLAAILSLILVGSYGLYVWLIKDSPQLGQAFILYSVIIALSFRTNVLSRTYRANLHFYKLARIKVITTIVTAISVLFVLFNPWYGLLIKVLLLQIINYFYLRRYAPFKLVNQTKKVDFKELIRIGIPLWTVGTIYTLFEIVDRTVVLKYFGVEGMGLYVPALQIMEALGVLPTAISTVIYPRLCQKFGETGSSRSLAKIAFIPPALLAVGLIPIFGFGVWFVDPFINYFLPDFAGGIDAARWVVIAMYFRSLGSSLSVFHAINRLIPYTVFIVIGILVMLGSTLYTINVLGWGIEGASFGRAAGQVTFVILSILGSLYFVFIKDVKLKIYGDNKDNIE